MTRQRTTEEEERTANSGFKKLAVQWLIEVQFSNQTLVQVDSFVPRNRQLLKPAKRYRSCYDDSANIKRQCKYEQTKNSDEPCLPSFAKAKEKQRDTQSQRKLLHICFCPTAQLKFKSAIKTYIILNTANK